MAIVWIPGNWLRIVDSNSKPDIPGMLRSVRMMSGISCRISCNAENPSEAVRTRYPISMRTCDIDVLIEGSSSTMRSPTFASCISHPLTASLRGLEKVFHGSNYESVQFRTELLEPYWRVLCHFHKCTKTERSPWSLPNGCGEAFVSHCKTWSSEYRPARYAPVRSLTA